MIVTSAFYLAFISMGTAELWRMNKRTSDWNFQTVHLEVKFSSIITQSETSSSLTGCVIFCSNIADIVVPSLFFLPKTSRCICNSETGETTQDGSKLGILYGTRRAFQQIELTDKLYQRTTVWPYKHDCSDLYEALYNEDGVYVIYPPGGYLTDVWCDMAIGGWTVIQRRIDGSENFYRGWNDYVMGFGNRTGEYWLGLENIYRLTKNGSQLYIYTEVYPEVTPQSMSAYYSNFKIGDLASDYALAISGFVGTCGDSMAHSNGKSFTTFDNDNDEHSANCAVKFVGAWWYNSCHCSHLNGVYYTEGTYSTAEHHGKGIDWCTCWNHSQSSKFAFMEIKK